MTGSRAAVFPLPPRGSPSARLNATRPLDFPSAALAEVTDDDWVLDPFYGRATPLFAARLRGLGSVGIDANPPDPSRQTNQFSAPGNYAEGIDCYA